MRDGTKELVWIKRFVSFEPLLENITLGRPFTPDWIIIGGLTGCKQKTEPKHVRNLVGQIPKGIPIFVKNNLDYKPKLQQFPKR